MEDKKKNVEPVQKRNKVNGRGRGESFHLNGGGRRGKHLQTCAKFTGTVVWFQFL